MIKKMYLSGVLLMCIAAITKAQSPAIKWQKAVNLDTSKMIPEDDGGFGTVISATVTPKKVVPVKGGDYMVFDGSLIKMNAFGDTLFVKSTSFDIGETPTRKGYFLPVDIATTQDSGVVVVGHAQAWDWTWPEDWHYVYLMRYDHNGNLLWRERYNTGLYPYYADGVEPYGSDENGNPVYRKRYALTEARSVLATPDGGYLLTVGTNAQKGNDKSEDTKDVASPMLWHYGDYWIIKTGASGLIEWEKTIGGAGTDRPFEAINTPDGGYIIGGLSYSSISADKSENPRGTGISNNDLWLVKINAIGNVVWDKTIGTTSENDQITFLTATADGGFLVGANTLGGIGGDKTDTSFGNERWDAWVLKCDGSGNIQWQKTLGGSWDDDISSVYQQADGSYIMGGSSSSPVSGNKTVDTPGDYWLEPEWIDFGDGTGIWTERQYVPAFADYWILKLSSTGNILWQKSLGGLNVENFAEVLPAKDGILVFGSSYSDVSGNRTEVNKTIVPAIYANGSDLWTVMLDETILPVNLLTFTGQARSAEALLQWKTATELSFSYFELEKSTDLLQYAKVVKVPAKGNNSSYAYTDNIGSGTTYYRLKMVDKDGAIKYSNIVAITSAGSAAVTIAPNPIAAGALLTMTLPPAPKNAYLQIIGIDGKMYGSKTVPEGAVQLKIDTKTLAKGNYVLAYTHNGKRDVMRFIKN